ncbi:XrtB/PEP-CTERM-associated polysaccharide biosynthesis outer membrane protein EpsL [Duganella violaceipulchra]|uniref:Exopolysaccharide biosynthesis operon protein EpsL n=1 Tax=Duganella violaceipulchra TaxID=2849652 RepID=A0AA41L2A4_9BURK|nr:XrtB/PEP-CTERM-associated polysaccharide biosynthesis outer membrane protein EpsL [Duganella violaceicalia]MBV6319959.1 hypothetical protein [Duganella violaceicalia]MCP2010323.1 exopolysaccharide biosynthesis operon protein EpsL [Duganella violaceicalia]
MSGLLTVVLGVACVAPARAELSDTIHPFAAVSRNYDANLFRLPDGAAGAGGERDDTTTQYRGGVVFERPLGRQLLTGRVEASRVAFARNDSLDYNGKDAAADLAWMLGNHLDGHLGVTYAQTLTSFSDFHISEQNLRVQRREYVDGGWRLHPSWRVHGAYSTQKSTYSLAAQKFNDRTEDDASVGLDYLASSGSRVGLQVGRQKGAYPNHLLLGFIPIDDSYTQNDVKLNVQWIFSATSQFQMLAGRARRTHNFLDTRDASGVNGSASFNWSMLRKLRMNSSVWRRFTAVESTSVSNSINTGALLTGDWELTGKTAATFSARQEKRDFIVIPGVTALRSLDDRTRNVSAGLSYQPTQQIQLALNLFRETRSGNELTNYHTHGTSFSASVQF